MHHTNDILNELKELNSVLGSMSRRMPYHVPAGYFEGLGEQVLTQIKLADTPDPISTFDKQMPYDMPAGYFESFAANIISRVQEAALPSVKEMPFDVPAGYFDSLPAQLLQAAKQAGKTSKTISLGVRVWKQVRWAAAAVLLLGIGIGTYSSLSRKAQPNFNKQLASLSQDDIKSYVEQNIDDFDADMIAGSLRSTDIPSMTSNVSEQEILNYLDGEANPAMN